MKRTLTSFFCLMAFSGFSVAQSNESTIAQGTDSIKTYRKRVLESTEVSLLMSFYSQDGSHSPVNGGIGSEKLEDKTPTIIISTPLNNNDVLTIDAGISAYTSASSSNINPFMTMPSTLKSAPMYTTTAASRGGGTVITTPTTTTTTPAAPSKPYGTPWLASTGASHYDMNKAIHADYSHSSDSRNLILGTNVAYSKEFDYISYGFGGNVTGLFNEKNTEIGLKGSAYLDTWKPIYPTELREYMDYGLAFQTSGYFKGVTVMDSKGNATTAYLPSAFKPWAQNGRNSYTLSFFASQILSQKLQAAFFFDLVLQEGMLSTPYQRVYFKDKPSYYIGYAAFIPVYTTPDNTAVYRLADDIERLPQSRYKFPFGVRASYYINETFVLKGYYRYYFDNWGLKAHTLNLDLPIRLNQSFSITPSFRYYIQNQVDYFAPYDTHLSTEKFYTSDYDLSKFTAENYSIAMNYTDVFNTLKISKFGFKNFNVRYSHYSRSDGLDANIISFGIKFVGDK